MISISVKPKLASERLKTRAPANRELLSKNDNGTFDGHPALGAGKIGVFELIQTGTCFDDITVTEP